MQVRRASCQDADDLDGVLDIYGIQQYVINKAFGSNIAP
jgi:hypothetical protein